MSHSHAVAPEQTESSALSITIERSLLLKALGHVQSVVERRNTIAILGNVKLVAKSGMLSLTATDMDISITENVPANTLQEGSLTVPAHTLYDIVRKLPDGSDIELSGDAASDGRLTIQSGNCHFTLSCLPVTDFPSIDVGDMPHQFSLPKDTLAKLIDKTRFAVSTEETRYYLNGIYLHVRPEGEYLTAVATDGHRLAKVDTELPQGASQLSGVIIPRKTVNELRKLIDEAEEHVEIALSDVKAQFTCGNALLTSKLIDGSFPDYDKVIPAGNDKHLEVSADDLIHAVDRVSTISSEKTRAIKLSASNGQLGLSASNEESGSASETLEASYDSGDIDVGFNSRYLLEMLGSIDGDMVKFALADGGAPAIVSDPSSDGVLFVIMPMRI